MSLPSRECGLKSLKPSMTSFEETVTPFAGVWIEIRGWIACSRSCSGHSLRGSVD